MGKPLQALCKKLTRFIANYKKLLAESPMKTKTMHISPLPTEVQNGFVVRKCKVERYNDDVLARQDDLWFRFAVIDKHPEDDDCDAYLLAMIMDAMMERRNVIVNGSVSKELLSNMVEFQTVWRKWVPQTYHIIDMTVDRIRENERCASGAICAFSGGVDGAFSVWRHSQKFNSYRSQDVKLCAFIHGFDIPLSDTNAYNKCFERLTKTLEDINVPLSPIATNYRQITDIPWEHGFASAMVATLSNFKKLAGTCIFGSGEPYDDLVIPWASSPITIPLFNAEGFKVMYDGASHSRTEKVEELAAWRVGCDNLRVCWEGEFKDRNCGKCEKCLRTQLNFLATGNDIPACFPQIQNLNAVLANIIPYNDVLRAEWRQILAHAKSKGTQASWMQVVSKVIRRKRLRDRLFPENSPRRRIVKTIARKVKAAFKRH